MRVVLVAAATPPVALLFAHGGGSRFAGGYFPPVNLPDIAATAAVALVGGGLGLASRIPAGVLLGPLALGGVLNVPGWVTIELPPVVLIASYALIGWNIGLGFTREVLVAVARALPQSLGAIALLIGFCGLLAWMLVALLHVDPLTAYLATSPGGGDAAAIIAASTKVDTPFVMAVQTLRVIVVLFVGPAEKLLAAARSADMPVIYVVASFRPDYPEISPRNRTFSLLAQNGLLQAGSPGTQIHSAVAPLEREPVVIKHRVGAFSGTDLQTILQSRAIETLVLTGVSTSVVVLSTLRQAFDLDYRILVAGDCCADPDREVHDMLLSRVFPKQATVTSVALLCDAIRT
jgi:membrane AbrB-like protein